MKYFHRIIRGLGTRSGGAAHQGTVVLQYRPTGEYLAAGARLASEAGDAIIFDSHAAATELVSRFAPEPHSFVAVPAPAALTSAA
jgi:hypothetical protein